MFLSHQTCRVAFFLKGHYCLFNLNKCFSACLPVIVTQDTRLGLLGEDSDPEFPGNHDFDHYFCFYETAVLFCANVKFFLRMLLFFIMARSWPRNADSDSVLRFPKSFFLSWI